MTIMRPPQHGMAGARPTGLRLWRDQEAGRRSEARQSFSASIACFVAEPQNRFHPQMNFEPFRFVDANNNDDAGDERIDAASFRNVIEICAYITENFREDIGSSEVASYVEIHPKYAMSVFKRSTGMALNEYITLLRLSYAQSLLLDPELTILDVAMESGFVSLSTFNQSFRKFSGQTPSEFRRQNALVIIDL